MHNPFCSLSHLVLYHSVSFIAFCLSFLSSKYLESRYGFLSSFRPICLTIFVSSKSFSRFFLVENAHFRAPLICQYLLASPKRNSPFSLIPRYDSPGGSHYTLHSVLILAVDPEPGLSDFSTLSCGHTTWTLPSMHSTVGLSRMEKG